MRGLLSVYYLLLGELVGGLYGDFMHCLRTKHWTRYLGKETAYVFLV